MVPYIFLFLICLANTKANNKFSNYFTIISLILFSALRYDVGYDYDAYLGIMERPTNWGIGRLESFEKLLIEYCIQIKFHQLFFIVNSLITILCVWGGLNNLKKSGAVSDLSISILIFLTVPLMFLQSFSIVRHWTALALVFYGSTWLFRGKTLYFIVCIILSTTCHNVGWIGLLYYPLYKFKVSLKINIIVLILCMFLGEVFKEYILSYFWGSDNPLINKFVGYVESEHGESGLTKIPYLFLLFDVIFLSIRGFNSNDNGYYHKFSTMFNVGCSLMFLLSFQTTISLRFSTLFLVYILVLFPYFIRFLKSHGNTAGYVLSRLLIILILGAMYFYVISIYNISLGKSQYLPYQIYLSHQ